MTGPITLPCEPAPAHWPAPLDPAAFYGPVGRIVQMLIPYTEADPAALIFQLLAGLGNQIGRNPFFRTDGGLQHCNINTVIVGQSSKARKGTSWGRVFEILERTDPSWEAPATGLNSGEGLVSALQDKEDAASDIVEETDYTEGHKPKRKFCQDKRMLLLEAEFARMLTIGKRDSNTVSTIIRDSFDTGDLRIINKNSPQRATNTHVCIVGHITHDELDATMTSTDYMNGFANRFLWVCAHRSKLLPDGGHYMIPGFDQAIGELAGCVARAKEITEVKRDEAATARWIEIYPKLSVARPGKHGAVAGRAETYAVRLALILAVLDGSVVITLAHLKAAEALWDYADRSVKSLFGAGLGNADADTIYEALKDKPFMSMTEISKLFNNHRSIQMLRRSMEVLADAGLVTKELVPTRGRPCERWKLK